MDDNDVQDAVPPPEVGGEHEFIRRSLNAKVPTEGGRDRESED